ncbi:MAG: F0F1 ATP synthase subunit delta [Thiohalocapsa sp.]|jgi:F-type H+-transporting ATPase subunit delta|nr:F0F1 ATP synthase subunit delta [Thiohalocapsa sp.]MCF7990258.1 F0F1 ATP synthase subunit delta [Thiohalocapsa sp.]
MAGDSTTIARPYAEAAFDVAKQRGALDAWSETLATLAAIVEDPQIAVQVGNLNVPTDAMRDLLFGIVGEGLSAELQNLVRLLAANRRLSVLPDISRLFDQMKTADQGLRHVHVQSAYAFSEADQAELVRALKARFGSNVELTVEQRPELLGGIRIRADDVVIDGTVRAKLEQLSNELQF